MSKVTILNIPNYYCSAYHFGLTQISDLRFSPRAEFAHLNNKPFLVFEYQGKVAVIENDDPMGVDLPSYSNADLYFATNKLLARDDYNMPKVQSLYPHYPINNANDYAKLVGWKGLKELGPKELLRQWYTIYRRPEYVLKEFEPLEGNYVFFAGSIWKKEPWANQIRGAFVKACQNNPLIQFEGGMIPRTDGDLCGLAPELLNRKYSAKEFAAKSSKSVIGFNNPAVLDAVSWRLAEYWNYGCFVISFPFKIDMPSTPKHGEEIHYLTDSSEFDEVLTFGMKNVHYRKKVAGGGKAFYEKNCRPEVQAKRILELLENAR